MPSSDPASLPMLVMITNAASPKTTWDIVGAGAAFGGSVVVVVVVATVVLVVVVEEVDVCGAVAAGNVVSGEGGCVESVESPFPPQDARMRTVIKTARRMTGSVHGCGCCAGGERSVGLIATRARRLPGRRSADDH